MNFQHSFYDIFADIDQCCQPAKKKKRQRKYLFCYILGPSRIIHRIFRFFSKHLKKLVKQVHTKADDDDDKQNSRISDRQTDIRKRTVSNP